MRSPLRVCLRDQGYQGPLSAKLGHQTSQCTHQVCEGSGAGRRRACLPWGPAWDVYRGRRAHSDRRWRVIGLGGLILLACYKAGLPIAAAGDDTAMSPKSSDSEDAAWSCWFWFQKFAAAGAGPMGKHTPCCGCCFPEATAAGEGPASHGPRCGRPALASPGPGEVEDEPRGHLSGPDGTRSPPVALPRAPENIFVRKLVSPGRGSIPQARRRFRRGRRPGTWRSPPRRPARPDTAWPSWPAWAGQIAPC